MTKPSLLAENARLSFLNEAGSRVPLAMPVGAAVGWTGVSMAASGSMVTILAALGDRLGLFKTLAASGPATSPEVAVRAGLVERYVREWLINQAAGGYVEYDAATGRYHLTIEHVTFGCRTHGA